MPVQGADGICGLHSQDGQRQQKQCFNSGHGKSFKINIKITVQSTNEIIFVI